MIRDTDEVTTLLDPITTLPPEFRPLRVEEYHRLIDTGVFDGTHVEPPQVELAEVPNPRQRCIRLTCSEELGTAQDVDIAIER